MLLSNTVVQLALLVAAATAFQTPCIINIRHTPQNAIFRHYAKKEEELELIVADSTQPVQPDVYSRIEKVLSETKEELLSDVSLLQKKFPQSTNEADNEMRSNLNFTTKQMVREVLLSSRLPLPFLNKSEVGQSLIEGAGRGLFATEDITKGDVITCYPGDALLCGIPIEDESVEDESEEEDWLDEDDDYADEIEVIVWGAHVPEKHIWEEDVVFDGDEETNTPPLTTTAALVNDLISVLGHPALDDNPAYFGHFANDGAGHLALDKPLSTSDAEGDNEEMGVEKQIAAYVSKSQEAANVILQPSEEEMHMLMVATRDITKGEEILLTYGPDFWLGHAE